MQTFFNDIKIKNKYVNRVRNHEKNDEIVQGVYWENGKGCGVGCTIEGSDHYKYETELGIPRVIAKLEDRIFEGLSNEEAKTFPLRFLQAVPVGADLSMVMPKFFVWLLGDKKDGVINFAKGYKKTEKAIKGVLKLYQETVGGKTVTKERWIKVKDAAADAYATAASYATTAAAAAASYADAYAAASYAAASYTAASYTAAAYATAAYATVRKNARQIQYSKMANKLIEIISECK